MQLSSNAFDDGAPIPPRYTCDGEDVSPPLTIEGAPDAAAALVLVMDDPDAPSGTWDHWIAFDIPVATAIPEDVGMIGRSGKNSWGRTGYGGPCPPSGTHRYVFRVIAVSAELGLSEGADKTAVLEAARSVILDEASLMGTYAR